MNVPLKRYWELLVKYLGPMWRKVLLMSVLVLTGTGLGIVNPLVLRFFIDTAKGTAAQQPSTLPTLILVAAAFLGISLLTQVVGVIMGYVGADIAWRTTNQLSIDVLRHCLRLDLSFHSARTPGEMIARIDGDVGSIGNFFSQFIFTVLSNSLLIVGTLIVLAYVDWRISVTLVLYVIVGLVGMSLSRNVLTPHWRESRQADADLFGLLEEQLSSREDIRSSGAGAYMVHNLLRSSKARLGIQIKSNSMGALLSSLWMVLQVIGQIVSFVFAYSLFRRGEITIGTVFMIMYYVNLIFQPLTTLAGQMMGVQYATASILRIDELIATQSKIQESHTQQTVPAGPLTVVFDKVSFSYNETEPVLQNVSFCLRPGQVLGLLGRTGSGKTTLTHLLFRLYDPSGGSIRLGTNENQVDIREIGLDDLHQRISVVTQNVQLFQTTVRNNLTFFDKGISDDRILQAIKELGLSDWYASLPEGLDSMLETGGSNLSAGEAQLLAFTRVFLKNPDLVVLDEASSRLDLATEQLIERAVSKLLRNRTGIVIAHRLGTVHRADQIMIIEKGQIQEFGNHDDLAYNPTSYFYRLLQTGMEEVLT
jgi:ABC-type multidrug transport system fused ATPase/permease subunit